MSRDASAEALAMAVRTARGRLARDMAREDVAFGKMILNSTRFDSRGFGSVPRRRSARKTASGTLR